MRKPAGGAGKSPRGKSPQKPSMRLGTYGERVGRERAARRRAARDKQGLGGVSHGTDEASAPQGEEPEFIEIPQSDLANELSVLAALIMSGLARSHPEARRLFRDAGLMVNGVAVMSDKAKLLPSDVSPEGEIELSVGDGRRARLRPV